MVRAKAPVTAVGEVVGPSILNPKVEASHLKVTITRFRASPDPLLGCNNNWRYHTNDALSEASQLLEGNSTSARTEGNNPSAVVALYTSS